MTGVRLHTAPKIPGTRVYLSGARGPGFGDIHGPKPYKFIGFGATDVTKPCEFVGFGAMDVTKPY